MKKSFAVALLAFIIVAELIVVSGNFVSAQATIPTTSSITAQSNPVAVGQSVQFNVMISPPPPTSNDTFLFTVQITLPGHSSTIIGPYSTASTGFTYFQYTPTAIGNYTLLLKFAGQTFTSTNQTYASSQSMTILNVQQSVSTPSPTTAPPKTTVVGILTTDTTWNQAGSPYTLSGPVAINTGVTLTIQPGASVNLNGYYIQVNGTLTAKGTTASPIQIQNGLLRFTPVSNEWNDNAGTGCTIQNANLAAVTISAVNAVKLDQDTISDFGVAVGGSSILTNDQISSAVTVGDSSTASHSTLSGGLAAGNNCTISFDTIGGVGIAAGDACTITGNNVQAAVQSGNSSAISNNTIEGSVTGGLIIGNIVSSGVTLGETLFGDPISSYSIDVTGNVVSNNNIINGTIKATQTVSNNIVVAGTYQGQFRVFGGYATPYEDTSAIIAEGSTIITSNTVTGGGIFTSYGLGSLGPGYYSDIPAIALQGTSQTTISNNIVTAKGTLAIRGVCSSISGNTVKGDISVAGSSVTDNNVTGSLTVNSNGIATATVQSNVVTATISVSTSLWNVVGNTAATIIVSSGSGQIYSNYVSNGAGISVTGVSATVVNNQITNIGNSQLSVNDTTVTGTNGISVTNGTATISNNTITGDAVGIALYPSASVIINYNNIYNNDLNVVLESGMATNVNATSNWWGTTDTQAINQSIFDSKRDFNLGTVTFTPFLTSPNTQSAPTEQPATSPSPPPTPTTRPTSNPTPIPTQTTSPTSSPSTSATPTTQTPSTSTLATPSPTFSATPTPQIPEFAIWITVPLAFTLVIIAQILRTNAKKR